MRVLFIGNSITRGEIGESFIDLFRADYPDWEIKNAGINADTLKNISDRITHEISICTEYDYIIIEAGHNDVILPFLRKKGFLFQLALKHLQKKGRKPLNQGDFKSEYIKVINLIKTKTNAKIILTTLSCINEDLSSYVNKIRSDYNHLIRNIADYNDCLLADISQEFDSILNSNIQTNFLLDRFIDTVYFDSKKCQKIGGADKLSKKRKLQLTIDGVHLNSIGANLYKQTIEKQIITLANKYT